MDEPQGRPFWQWIVVFLLIALSLTYVGASWFFSDVLINFSTKTLEEDRAQNQIVDLATFGFANAQEVSIDTGQVVLSGWYVANQNPCGVILLHGHTSTRFGTLDYAPLFVNRGCHVLAYDHRKHGASTGRYGTYGAYESQDLLAALAYFKSITGLQDQQIGVLGESYGGATAIIASESAPNLAFVVADSSYESLRAIVTEQAVSQYGPASRLLLPGAFILSELRAQFRIENASPIKAIERTRVPTLLIHSQQDTYTLPEHSEHLFASSDKSRTRLFISNWGAGHVESIKVNPQAYAQVVDEFLGAHAPQFPARVF